MSQVLNQILLYSKHWYGHSTNEDGSTNIIFDLKHLIAKTCMLNVEHVSIADVRGLLVDAFNHFVTNEFVRNQALTEMLGWKWGRLEDGHSDFQDRKPEEVILSSLMVVDGDYVDFKEKFEDLCFSKVDRETCDDCHRKRDKIHWNKDCQWRFV
jgi:hypothetical protein